ncbi:Transmembrane protein [Phytophthora palmivora]|uniref:Transmembrane protein n=2 Tax=Phytophthora palmivora TaxID=4796 RepID=A0A2P4Y0Z4_9STRA|nr:Transmembrane protein [Phytophthora palmivora]
MAEDKSKTDVYTSLKSPVAETLEAGELRAARGSVSVFTWQNIGMIAQESGGGLVYGTISGVIYTVLNNYLHMSATLVATATALVGFPRSLRVFTCMLSDTIPIFGYRRRPYMVIGWLMTGIACLLMSVLPLGDPYYGDQSIANKAIDTLSAEQIATIDFDAPSRGIKLIILLTIGQLGTTFSYSGYSGVLVDISQQESAESRGTAMGNGMIFYNIFSILSAFFTGLALNTPEYGGSFSWTVTFNGVMGVCAAMSFIVLPFTWFCIQEEKMITRPAKSVFVYLYELVQTPIVYRFIAFRFFYNVFSLFSVTASSAIQSTWAKVEPVNNGIATMIAALVTLIGTWIVKTYGLGWNWRVVIVAAQLLVVCIDVWPTFFTIWDVVRSQWLWLGVPLLEKVPAAAAKYIGALFMLEIETEGFDATLFGLGVTAQDVGRPFATVLTKTVNGFFDVERTFIEKDDHHVRSQITIVYVIAYIINLLAAAFVLLLPTQKTELHQLKREGLKSKRWGIVTLVLLGFALSWTLMTNILSLFDSTKCLRIAGGSGC